MHVGPFFIYLFGSLGHYNKIFSHYTPASKFYQLACTLIILIIAYDLIKWLFCMRLLVAMSCRNALFLSEIA